MNITLDLSKGQLSKLRNGHGIRISPTMVGSGVDLIVDTMSFHHMMKKLDKGKGAIIKMGSSEIDMNKTEGTGLFLGAGNKSGKISRIKKAKKWRDFSKETAKDGIDTAAYGYKEFQKAVNPIGSKVKSLFGAGVEEEMEGGKISFTKEAYNKHVKNTAVGKALKKGAKTAITKGYEAVEKGKIPKPLADYMARKKTGAVKKMTAVTGLGLTVGNGTKLSGGHCSGCGMYNDKFVFSNQSI